MKRLLLASLFFLLPITAFAVPTKPEQFEKLENEFSLECQKYGAESCAARFISMAACTYVFAVNQGKHPDEAMDISDKLFVGIMRGNKIKPEIMFTEEKNIKPIIIKSNIMFSIISIDGIKLLSNELSKSLSFCSWNFNNNAWMAAKPRRPYETRETTICKTRS